MALLLGAFLVVGITPGPKMLEEHLTLSFSLAWTSILANVISSLILYVSARQLVKITLVNPRTLAPLILVFATIGAYSGMRLNLLFSAGLLAFLIVILLYSQSYPFEARLFPSVIGVPVTILYLLHLSPGHENASLPWITLLLTSLPSFAQTFPLSGNILP